jgi:peptidoglycan endopeptidase LytE
MEIIRILALNYAIHFIGTWYSWGGDTPNGFDCSGFVNEILKSVGKIERKSDYTAQELYNMFPKVVSPREGVLAFWWNKNHDKIIHVEFCKNTWQTIGASGGGSNTITKEDAIRDGAFIKVRPIKEGAVFADPFLIGG